MYENVRQIIISNYITFLWLMIVSCMAQDSCPNRCICISQIKAIPASFCNGLRLETVPKNIVKTTEILSLRTNNIKNLTNEDFSGLHNLKRLNLVFNEIEYISDNAFQNLQKLQSLNLGYNNIKTLSSNIFRNLISLEELFLNNNLIQILPKDIFSLLPNLKRISLQSNQITDDPNLIFGKLDNLEKLNLAHNKIQTVTEFMFRESNKLKSLYLDDNKIKTIDSYSFASLGELTELYLDNNALVTLDIGLLESQSKLERISLYNNPLRCDCNLYWITDFLAAGRPTFQHVEKMECQSPLKLEGKPVSTLIKENFNCFGSWGVWGEWSGCNRPCLGGVRYRTRGCVTNARSNYQGFCKGNDMESEECNTFPCSKGVLTRWSEWSPCSASCNDAQHRRERQCINPYTGLEAASCEEPLFEIADCPKKDCPVNGQWGDWGKWTDCDKNCGLGMKSRQRTCTNPSPKFGGELCLGGHLSKQSKICFKALCPPKIHWAGWSDYSECSVSCGKGVRTRRRDCLNEYNVTIDILNICPGSRAETLECAGNAGSCANDGGWSNWLPWTTCSPMSCKKYRSRTCTEPKPTNGGKECKGDSREDEPCNPKHCVVHAMWSQWQQWSSCSHPCNGGTRKRHRSCPGEQYKRVTCGKKRWEEETCNTQPCQRRTWSEWGDWSECNDAGKQVRKRTCNGNKSNCPGKEKERQLCKSGDWQGEVVISNPLKCTPRGNIPNGREYVQRKGDTLITTYVCNKFYKLKGGSSEMKCIEGKGWSAASAPYCSPICGKPVHKSNNHWTRRARLLGGKFTVPHSWPWQVAIEVETQHEGWKLRCGGSLLNDRWIVTAGHCLFDKNPTRLFKPEEIKIFLGTHNVTRRYKDQKIQLIEAGYVEAYPQFEHDSLNNDIGLIELKRPAKLNDKVIPVCLPSSKQKNLSKRGKIGTVVGWGVTNKGKASSLLQELELPVVPQRECIKAYSDHYNVTQSMFCAGRKNSFEDTCKGDSGGGYLFRDPKKKKWTIQGIVSWGGKRCGEPGKFSVYTRVSKFTHWARKVMKRSLFAQRRSGK